MDLSEEMAAALQRRFKHRITNVPVLDQPVFVVFDYSPTTPEPPLSIAFDCGGDAKCWLSERDLIEIGDHRPKSHPAYKEFTLEGRQFHPFSVEAFGMSIFENIEELTIACRRLYGHISWS